MEKILFSLLMAATLSSASANSLSSTGKLVPSSIPKVQPAKNQDSFIRDPERKREIEQERIKANAPKDKKEKIDREQAAKIRKDEYFRLLKDKESEMANVQEEAEQAVQENLRRELTMQRIQKLTVASSGLPEDKSLSTSAPSAEYAAKIIKQIKENIIFNDDGTGLPTLVVLVRVSSSGLILSRRVVNSSGNKAFDHAVLRAVDKMANVPSDTDGRIPKVLLEYGLEIKVTR